MVTATSTRQSTRDIVFELDSHGRLRPYDAAEANQVVYRYDRAGRKSRTALYSIRLRHDQAVQAQLERERRTGKIEPPDVLLGLPLVASWYLWRLSSSVSERLSSATYMLHRKLIRTSTGIDIAIAFESE